MTILFLIIASLLSAILFDILPVFKTVKNIFNLQKESLKLFRDPKFSDEQKQKVLFRYSFKIFLLSIKQILMVSLALLPFFVLAFIEFVISKKCTFIDISTSFMGFFITLVTFAVYLLIKKGYGKLRI
jgi:hypothetical protein